MNNLGPELQSFLTNLVISWGTPGIIIVFLWDERRRLQNKIEKLETQLAAEMKLRLDQALSIMGTIKDYENTFESLRDDVKTMLKSRSRSRNND